MFKASKCYDVSGKADIQMRCPPLFHIRPVTSFMGISRTNACSYQPWDCVIQEGYSHECNNKHMCTITVGYQESHKRAFFCGTKGTTVYFQVEYDCVTGKRSTTHIFLTTFNNLNISILFHHQFC